MMKLELLSTLRCLYIFIMVENFLSFYDKQIQRSPVSHIGRYIISCIGNHEYC